MRREHIEDHGQARGGHVVHVFCQRVIPQRVLHVERPAAQRESLVAVVRRGRRREGRRIAASRVPIAVAVAVSVSVTVTISVPVPIATATVVAAGAVTVITTIVATAVVTRVAVLTTVVAMIAAVSPSVSAIPVVSVVGGTVRKASAIDAPFLSVIDAAGSSESC
jgi:hypothetical protein